MNVWEMATVCTIVICGTIASYVLKDVGTIVLTLIITTFILCAINITKLR